MRKTLITLLAALGINLGAKAQTEKLDVGLENILKITAERLEKKNHAYIINIAKDNVVIIQIVHGALIQEMKTDKNKFNFSLNLCFDDEKDKLDKFKNLAMFNSFHYNEFDEIPCYATNFKNDQLKTKKIVLEILSKVYGFEKDDRFEFEVYDQGPIR